MNMNVYTYNSDSTLKKDSTGALILKEIPDIDKVHIESERNSGRQVSKDIDYPKMAQGASYLASTEDLIRHEVGFTNPNLHRSVDPQFPMVADDVVIGDDGLPKYEFAHRGYRFTVGGVDSYRTTEIRAQIDYQNLATKSKAEEYFGYSLTDAEYEELLRRFDVAEHREIP